MQINLLAFVEQSNNAACTDLRSHYRQIDLNHLTIDAQHHLHELATRDAKHHLFSMLAPLVNDGSVENSGMKIRKKNGTAFINSPNRIGMVAVNFRTKQAHTIHQNGIRAVLAALGLQWDLRWCSL